MTYYIKGTISCNRGDFMALNGKKQLFDYENSIKKSNELSMAKLSHGLTLNQMQLLAYAIYCTQQDGKTEFIKADFEKRFGLTKYNTEDAYEDSERILGLKIANEDLKNDRFKFWNAFSNMEYDNGRFIFEWNPKMTPHILELKEKYVMTDLTITAHFKSSFSWTLYDYLKALHGYWHKVFSKEELMKLFNVEDRKTYQSNTGLFKKYVLDIAIAEINEHTEIQVHYKEEKQGRKITGFDIYWTSGKKIASATKKQIKELKSIVNIVTDNLLELINLSDDKNRQAAISYIRDIQAMEIHTREPISITAEFASQLIQQAKDKLRLLETMHEKENTGRDTSIYYNWLEDE